MLYNHLGSRVAGSPVVNSVRPFTSLFECNASVQMQVMCTMHHQTTWHDLPGMDQHPGGIVCRVLCRAVPSNSTCTCSAMHCVHAQAALHHARCASNASPWTLRKPLTWLRVREAVGRHKSRSRTAMQSITMLTKRWVCYPFRP